MQKINDARQPQEEKVPMPEPNDEVEGPQVAGEATSIMYDVANFQENEDSAPSLNDLASSLNVDQAI